MPDLLSGQVDAPATAPIAAPVVEFPEYLKGIEVGDDIKSEPMLRSFKNIGDVVKSYVHSKRMIGAEKLPIPTKNSTHEEWREVYHKLGLPKDIKEFSIKKKEGGKIPDEFIEGFKEKVFGLGVLPQQAQGIIDFYEEQLTSSESKMGADYKAQEEEEIAQLKKEWGQAFDLNIKKANAALAKYGNPEMAKMLSETGMGNNVHLVKFLTKVMESTGEDTFRGEGNSVSTRDQIISQMQSIRGNKAHPYYDNTHAGHKEAVALMESMAKQVYE